MRRDQQFTLFTISAILPSMIDERMEKKINRILTRHKELESSLANPDIARDQKKYKELMQEFSHLTDTVNAYHNYINIVKQYEEAIELAEKEDDEEMREMAKEEAHALKIESDKLACSFFNCL